MLKDMYGNTIKQTEQFFYGLGGSTYLCRLDDDKIFCTNLDNFDNIYIYHVDEFESKRAFKSD
jgi:hypothetical protein